MTVKPYTWEHQDAKGILAQSELAIVRSHAAEVGPAWPEKGSPDMPQAVAELRAWEVRLLAAVWALTLEPPPPKGTAKVLFPEFGPATRWKSNQHKATGVLLLNSLVLLSDTKGGELVSLNEPVHNLKTNGAGTDLEIEASNPYLAAFAVVVGATAWVVCTTVVAQKASEVIDRQLARREDSQRLMASTSSIIKIVEAHTAAEIKKGAALAMSEVERAAIDGLVGTQKIIAQKQELPLPSPLPSSSDIGTSFKIGATGLAVAAVVAAVLYFST